MEKGASQQFEKLIFCLQACSRNDGGFRRDNGSSSSFSDDGFRVFSLNRRMFYIRTVAPPIVRCSKRKAAVGDGEILPEQRKRPVNSALPGFFKVFRDTHRDESSRGGRYLLVDPKCLMESCFTFTGREQVNEDDAQGTLLPLLTATSKAAVTLRFTMLGHSELRANSSRHCLDIFGVKFYFTLKKPSQTAAAAAAPDSICILYLHKIIYRIPKWLESRQKPRGGFDKCNLLEFGTTADRRRGCRSSSGSGDFQGQSALPNALSFPTHAGATLETVHRQPASSRSGPRESCKSTRSAFRGQESTCRRYHPYCSAQSLSDPGEPKGKPGQSSQTRDSATTRPVSGTDVPVAGAALQGHSSRDDVCRIHQDCPAKPDEKRASLKPRTGPFPREQRTRPYHRPSGNSGTSVKEQPPDRHCPPLDGGSGGDSWERILAEIKRLIPEQKHFSLYRYHPYCLEVKSFGSYWIEYRPWLNRRVASRSENGEKCRVRLMKTSSYLDCDGNSLKIKCTFLTVQPAPSQNSKFMNPETPREGFRSRGLRKETQVSKASERIPKGGCCDVFRPRSLTDEGIPGFPDESDARHVGKGRLIAQLNSRYTDMNRRQFSSAKAKVSIPILDREDIALLKDKSGYCIEIGRGSYGSVFLAFYRKISKSVVVKKFFKENSLQFHIVHEASILQHLNDTGVTPDFYGVLRLGPDPADVTLVQECYGHGRTLRDLLSDPAVVLSEVSCVSICAQVAVGLRKIHKKKILVNDLNPNNILVDRRRGGFRIKFIDFGLASYKEGTVFDKKGDTLKRLRYLAPEVRRCHRTSIASDIYSLGVIIETVSCSQIIPSLHTVAIKSMLPDPPARIGISSIIRSLEHLYKWTLIYSSCHM